MTRTEYARKWQRQNREKCRASNLKWRLNNPEKVYTNYRNWFLANKKKRYMANALWREKYPEYSIWTDMNRRCNDSSRIDFPRYGGRGIKVLYKNFKEFLLDIGRRPSEEYTVDRINNDGNYEIGNCRWATKSQQMQNTRLCHK